MVAAQWALESGFGKHISGEHNYLGIKAAAGEPFTHHYTKEQDVNGKEFTILAKFRDFQSPKECFQWIVDKWYKDYKDYQGVNRANSEAECCDLLRVEGYATDTDYPAKLKRLINDHGIKTDAEKDKEKVVPFFLNAARFYRGLPHQDKAFLDLWGSLTTDQQQAFIRTYRSENESSKKTTPTYFYQRNNSIKPEASCQSAAIAMAIEYIRPELFDNDEQYLREVEKAGRSEEQFSHSKVLQRLGFDAHFLKNGTREILMDMLDDDEIVPLGVLHKGPHTKPTGGGHWITAYDYDEEGLICHDPYGLMDTVNGGYIARGPTDGRSVKYKWQYIIPRWDLGPGDHGWYWLIG